MAKTTGIGEVSWFEVMGSDLALLTRFYSELFGWKLVPIEGQPYHMTAPDWKGLPGGVGAGPGPGWTTFYVKVDDVEAAVGRAVAGGGKVLLPKMVLGDGTTIAVIADPEGHPVGLSRSAAG